MGKAVSAISIVLILCSLILGLSTKKSFVKSPYTNDYDSCIIRHIPTFTSSEDDSGESDVGNSLAEAYLSKADAVRTPVESEMELLKQVDFIAKVRFTGERTQQYLSTLSTVEVIEVYRGRASLEGSKVDMYEINYFSPKGEYVNLAPINLMKTGREYYVFLRECKYAPEYQKQLERPRFADYLVFCSVTPVDLKNEEIITDRQNLTYGKVKDLDYIFFPSRTVGI